jgi:hypothetical protein
MIAEALRLSRTQLREDLLVAADHITYAMAEALSRYPGFDPDRFFEHAGVGVKPSRPRGE